MRRAIAILLLALFPITAIAQAGAWIGSVVVVMSSGQIIADTALFGTKAECDEANGQLVKAINDAEGKVLAYKLQCLEFRKLDKPGANS